MGPDPQLQVPLLPTLQPISLRDVLLNVIVEAVMVSDVVLPAVETALKLASTPKKVPKVWTELDPDVVDPESASPT